MLSRLGALSNVSVRWFHLGSLFAAADGFVKMAFRTVTVPVATLQVTRRDFDAPAQEKPKKKACMQITGMSHSADAVVAYGLHIIYCILCGTCTDDVHTRSTIMVFNYNCSIIISKLLPSYRAK